MIPYQVALIAWIPIAAIFMLDRNSARGFSLAVIIGMMILPEAQEIELPGIPDIDKNNVTFIGVLIGTILFHPRSFDRFTLIAGDILLLGFLLSGFLSAYLNSYPLTFCVARTFTFFLGFVLPILLARIHIGTPTGIRTFLLWLIAGSVACVPFALYEFRMSPQIHTMVYGYFQHVFQQHFRGGFWRPIIFFSHALALGRFFAFTAFLAFLPMRQDLQKLFGFWGGFIFLVPLGGLLLSMSFGPYLLFGLLCVCYFVFQFLPRLVFVVPLVALTWLLVFLGGTNPKTTFVQNISQVNPERAASLQYRLDALQEYKSVILFRPMFGYGGWGGRIEGRATDSQFLISLIDRGIVGTIFYLGWWYYALYATMDAMRGSRGRIFARRAAAIAALTSLAIGIVTIDTAFDLHLFVALGAMLAIYPWLRREPPMPAGRRRHPAAQRAAQPEVAT